MTDLTQVLAGIDQALSVVKTIADTPGINMLPYVNTISGVIGAIQFAEQAGQDVLPYIQKLQATFSGNVPTEADLASLMADIQAMSAQIQRPLPPADPGEPEGDDA